MEGFGEIQTIQFQKDIGLGRIDISNTVAALTRLRPLSDVYLFHFEEIKSG